MVILFVTSLMFLTFIFFSECINRMFFESSIGLGLFAILLSYRLKRVHWSVALIFLVSILSSILMTNYPAIYIKNPPMNYLLSMEAQSLLAYFILISFGILPFLLEQKYFTRVMMILFSASLIDSIFMLIKSALYGLPHCFAMLSNSALDASFIACLLPIPIHIFYENKSRGNASIERINNLIIVSISMMIITIILTKSSTGIAAIGVVFASYWIMKYGIRALKGIVPLAIIIIVGSYFYLKDELLNPNGRFHIWKLAMIFYWKMTHLLIGAGVGTFFVWGPEIEKSERVHQLLATGLNMDQSWTALNNEISSGKFDMFTWLHNDWLQVLFEMGIIGLGCLIILYYFMVVKSWHKKNALFATVITYGFISLTQMTLRYFVFQLLGACLIMCVFDSEEVNERN